MKSITRLIILCAVLLGFLTMAAVARDEIDAYVCPWESDSITENAGKLQFFFMAGEGLKMTSENPPTEKWGESCLVAFPNGKFMLIDAGMPEYAPILIRNLERLGVEKLDYLLITHPHDDHAGGVYAPDGLPDHIRIGQAFYNGTYNAGWSDPKILEKVLAAHNVPLQAISEGWAMDIGEVRLQVFSPSAEVIGKTFEGNTDVNKTSIVMRFDYRDFSALFTGDIYKPKEGELAGLIPEMLDADLLKIPHHGNNTSNSKGFAEAVTPKIAVAMGRINLEPACYYVYTMQGSRVLTDLLDGYIHVSTDGETTEWDSSRERTIDTYDIYEYEIISQRK